jgi:hypothetical protein
MAFVEISLYQKFLPEAGLPMRFVEFPFVTCRRSPDDLGGGSVKRLRPCGACGEAATGSLQLGLATSLWASTTGCGD